MDPCTKFQLISTKIRTSTENGRILGLPVTKFKRYTDAQLVVSSWVLLSVVDFTDF